MKPKKKLATIPSPSLRYILEAIAVFFVSVFLVFFEPDSISDPINEMSFGLFSRVFNDAYPDSPEAQNAASVVIVNQNSLDELRETWPPSFGFHAEVLARILAAKPKAIIIDFLLVDEREDGSLEDFVEVLQYAQNENIPIVAARGTFKEYENKTAISALEPYLRPVAGWVKEGLGRSPFRYALAPASGGRRIQSAAVEAYEIFCDAAKIEQNLCSELDVDAAISRDMWVFWSARLPDFHKVFFTGDSRWDVPVDSPDKEKFRAFQCGRVSTTGGFLDRMIDSWSDEAATCPPQIALPAHYLIQDADPRIEKGLKDRIVFYGFGLEGFQDYVVPPTTANPIPGVFMHAMAFENLVEWGNDYLAYSAKGDFRHLFNANVVQLITLFMILVLYFGFLRYAATKQRQSGFKTKRNKAIRHIETSDPKTLIQDVTQFAAISIQKKGLRKTLNFLAIFFAFILFEMAVLLVFLAVSVYFEMSFLRIAPVNWMTILGFALINLLISIRIMRRDIL